MEQGCCSFCDHVGDVIDNDPWMVCVACKYKPEEIRTELESRFAELLREDQEKNAVTTTEGHIRRCLGRK